jgi:hypothetical protein
MLVHPNLHCIFAPYIVQSFLESNKLLRSGLGMFQKSRNKVISKVTLSFAPSLLSPLIPSFSGIRKVRKSHYEMMQHLMHKVQQ